jgi:hypothetical protein
MTAMNELRERLREAARRDIEAERARTRRRRRRATGFLALALLGGAAAAGAADLISIGEPVRDTRREQADYRPANPNALQLAVTAPSGGKVPFGVGIYDAKNGQRCAVAGQVRGNTLGRVEGGTFRPFEIGHVLGACSGAQQPSWTSADVAGRTLVFGRAKPGARVVHARVGRESRAAPTGRGGAFLFVYDRIAPTERVYVDIGD